MVIIDTKLEFNVTEKKKGELLNINHDALMKLDKQKAHFSFAYITHNLSLSINYLSFNFFFFLNEFDFA